MSRQVSCGVRQTGGKRFCAAHLCFGRRGCEVKGAGVAALLAAAGVGGYLLFGGSKDAAAASEPATGGKKRPGQKLGSFPWGGATGKAWYVYTRPLEEGSNQLALLFQLGAKGPPAGTQIANQGDKPMSVFDFFQNIWKAPGTRVFSNPSAEWDGSWIVVVPAGGEQGFQAMVVSLLDPTVRKAWGDYYKRAVEVLPPGAK